LDTTTDGRGGPRIAVVAQWRKGHTRVPITYLHALELAGASARVMSAFPKIVPGDEVPEDLDVSLGLDPDDPSPLEGAAGLLIPGGGDVDPALYRRPRHPRTHSVSQRRDRFELTLLGAALERDMPILAICHGMQVLNVHLGGTLVQHLADDPRRLEHDRDRPRAEPAHRVHLKHGCVLESIMGTADIAVNSHHHQGLSEAAAPLEEIGWAEDGVLEAVSSTKHTWVVGVQWHPEAMADTDSSELAIFEAFVDAARAYSGEISVARSA
jgi:putative glutamine amidotransferase